MNKLVRWMLVAAVCLASGLTTGVSSAQYATGSLKEVRYTLPNDSGKLYLTVVGSDSDAKYREIKQALASDPTLAPFNDAYHTKAMGTSSTMYQARYAQDYKAYPTVRVQRADGTPVYERVGKDIPATNQLVQELNSQCLPRNRQPARPPTHVTPQVTPQVTPTITPARPRLQTLFSVRVAVGMFCGGLILGMVQQWHQITSHR